MVCTRLVGFFLFEECDKSAVGQKVLAQIKRMNDLETMVSRKRNEEEFMERAKDLIKKINLSDPLDIDVRRVHGGWRWRVRKPSPDAEVHVGLRKLEPRTDHAAIQSEGRETALRVMQAANAEYEFHPLEVEASDDAWQGVVDEEGRLRVVITGPRVFAAGAVELRKLPRSRTERPQSFN